MAVTIKNIFWSAVCGILVVWIALVLGTLTHRMIEQDKKRWKPIEDQCPTCTYTLLQFCEEHEDICERARDRIQMEVPWWGEREEVIPSPTPFEVTF